MQERTNKRRVVLLIALLAVTALALWWAQRGGEALAADLFAVPDLPAVNEVVLQTGGKTVTLSYTGSRWKVNGEHDADRENIQALFATLAQARPKRPVPASLRDSLNTRLDQQGVRVQLRSGGATVAEFLAGGNEQKTQSFFRKAGDATPYAVSIPGFKVYVTGIFELPEKEWRNKYVFGFNWRNFQRLESAIPRNAAAGFVVTMEGPSVAIDGVVRPDTAKLNSYLDAVSLLTVDEYLEPSAFLDSLGGTPPLLTLAIHDVGRHTYTLKTWLAPSRRQVYGLIGENQWAAFGENKIRMIFRSKSFFEKP